MLLVTGVDGFIGSHLIDRLLADGNKVRAFIMYNSFSDIGWLLALIILVLKYTLET